MNGVTTNGNGLDAKKVQSQSPMHPSMSILPYQPPEHFPVYLRVGR